MSAAATLATTTLTISDAAAALRAGTVTAVELTSAALRRVTEQDGALGAFVTVLTGPALTAAAAADADFAAGVDRGPLQGIPLAVKDIISTEDAPTTANSRVLDPAWGGGVDAPVVARLRRAGAVVIGKSTTSEFACGLPDPTKGFPLPRNPWDLAYTASGSSSGTGIAVTTGMVLGGLGTDTGGSVRGPASVTGHTGLKVTFGRVPKNGVVPLAYSLDSVGPMARSALDCALLLETIAGHDPGDPHAAWRPVPAYSETLDGDVRGLRVGVARGYFLDHPGVDPEIRDAVLTAAGELQAAGAVLVDVEIPWAAEAQDANNVTWLGEAFAYHREDLVHRWADYGASTRDVLARAVFHSAADYTEAQRVRAVFRAEVARVFRGVDVLVTPTFAEPVTRIAATDMDRVFTGRNLVAQWNLTGQPAVSIPCGVDGSGLPIGLQVIGAPFDEATVLTVADAYQRRTGWHLRVPPPPPSPPAAPPSARPAVGQGAQ